MERPSGDHDLAEALAKVSRALQSGPTAQETLQKIVELAVATVHSCDHAGITMMNGRMWPPAATALGRTGTCLYARLDDRDGEWQAALGNAGHPPPLLITDWDAEFLDLPQDPLLGTDQIFDRATTRVGLPAGSTLLLFTDGLVERRDRDLADGLALLRDTAAELFAAPVDELCAVW